MVNRLAAETSPYLRQHRDNPVDWYAWGPDAFAAATERNVPILLSVGYSACHWCHVMAHECFEDAGVAAEMNRLFVNVKVDREERPDIDQIYQSAHQLLTRRAGGWPLTMFLTPDQKPFFGGTYFPKLPRYNLPGFAALCERVAQVYREQRSEIGAQNDELVRVLNASVPTADDGPMPGDDAIARAVDELDRVFDRAHGGLGNAPKFPHPAELELALSQGAILDAPDELRMELHTIRVPVLVITGSQDALGQCHSGIAKFHRTIASGEMSAFQTMHRSARTCVRIVISVALVMTQRLRLRAKKCTARRLSELPGVTLHTAPTACSERAQGCAQFHGW